MDRLDGGVSGRWLNEVEVRPVFGVEERRRWDALMRAHHYLAYRGLFGKSLRHVAVRGGSWLALLGWQAGAFKVGVRDVWIGWTRERQFARLHLIANNARFAVLPAGRVPNLASRVLGLSLRRLSGDVREAHGHLVLLAETFVDPSRYAGTCYRASNWVWLGRTRGFAREPGGSARWREHGQPKEVYVYELGTGGATALRAEAGPPPSASTFHYILSSLPPEALDRALDALHAQQETARALVEDCGADYVVTAVQGNQPTLLDDLRAMDWSQARHADGGWEKGHGRLQRRRCAALDLDGPQWARNGRALPACTDGGKRSGSSASGTSSSRDRKAGRPPTGSPRSTPDGPLPRRLRPSFAATGRSRTGSTMCATSPTTRTAAGRASATCRAISPA